MGIFRGEGGGYFSGEFFWVFNEPCVFLSFFGLIFIKMFLGSSSRLKGLF